MKRLIAFSFCALLGSCKSTSPYSRAQALDDSEANNKIWALSGFLPEAPDDRVWVSIKGRNIISVGAEPSAEVPENARVRTDALIFPGLMDLHGHVKYNVLPLWSEAKGQFLNRFEWRSKYPNYKKAVSFNMKALTGDTLCAAVRWAELKALVGGVTAIQGIGGDAKCAEDFGVNNVDILGDFQNDIKIRGMTDVVDPGMMANVFEKEIRPLMSATVSYDQAYLQFLSKYGIDRWITQIASSPVSLEQGLGFMLGNQFTEKWQLSPDKNMDAARLLAASKKNDATNSIELAAIIPELQLISRLDGSSVALKTILSQAPFSLVDTKLKKQLDSMVIWLGAYALATSPLPESQAYALLGKGGMLAFPSSYRRYINMFELSVRKSAIRYLDDPKALAIIAHVAEGQALDKYNQLEYRYLQTFGLNRSGMVMIHAVGLSEDNLREAKTNGLSIVWSPFSNLLLYGETLDMAAARRSGINIALGSDWSPTGSKSLLDELKVAKRWLKSQNLFISDRESRQMASGETPRTSGFTDRDLVDMATLNAAKAMRRDRVVGATQPGFQADLTLVTKKSANPWTDLVEATEGDIVLVSVKGEPLYGESSLIRQFATTFDGPNPPENLPLSSTETCGMSKAIRYPFNSKFDRTREGVAANVSWRNTQAIFQELTGHFSTYAETIQQTQPTMVPFLVKLDPMYRCEDPGYTARFDAFVEAEVPQNRLMRPTRRQQFQLRDDWSPLGDGTDSGTNPDTSEEGPQE